jgi:hypothetical protein
MGMRRDVNVGKVDREKVKATGFNTILDDILWKKSMGRCGNPAEYCGNLIRSGYHDRQTIGRRANYGVIAE